MRNHASFLHTPLLVAKLLLICLIWFMVASCAQNSTTGQNSPVPTTTSQNIITVHYNERPPYLVTTADGVTGLTGGPTTLAFENSGIPYRWMQTPTKRQIYVLQQNLGQDCIIAWFKNAERETFAKFTLPIYQDKPQIALARADNDKIPAIGKIEEFFTNSELTLLVKDGYSYGDFLDKKIQEYQPSTLVTTNENEGMLRMIHAGHGDYMLIAPEEAEGLISSSEFDAQDFRIIQFSDILSGENRYILCSLQVEDSVIKELNKAILQAGIVINEE